MIRTRKFMLWVSVLSILLVLVLSCSKKDSNDQAIEQFNKAIKLNPNDADAYWGRGVIYKKKGLYDKAIEDCSSALKINPKLSAVYYLRGSIYYEKNLYDQAILDLNKVLEIDPKDADTYIMRGLVYHEKNLYDQAILDFNKALEINPKNADAFFDRGNTYKRQRLYDQAIKDYNKALVLRPKDEKAHFEKARVCEEAGRYKEAIEEYTAFLQYVSTDDHNYILYIEHAKERIKELGEYAVEKPILITKQDIESVAIDFLIRYAKGDIEAAKYLTEDIPENKLAKYYLTSLRKFTFPIYNVKSLGYNLNSHAVAVEIEMPEISYLAGAAANMMSWGKLPSVQREIIRSNLIVEKRNDRIVVLGNELILMIGISAELAQKPMTLKRFPALQTYVLYAKALGLNDNQMKSKLMEIQEKWIQLGWANLLKTK